MIGSEGLNRSHSIVVLELERDAANTIDLHWLGLRIAIRKSPDHVVERQRFLLKGIDGINNSVRISSENALTTVLTHIDIDFGSAHCRNGRQQHREFFTAHFVSLPFNGRLLLGEEVIAEKQAGAARMNDACAKYQADSEGNAVPLNLVHEVHAGDSAAPW